MTEVWHSVPGWENLYEVSNFGNVRSVTRTVPLGKSVKTVQGRVLSPQKFGTKNHKRLAVKLSRNGEAKVRLVHHLVLEAFVGPRPPGLEGCHNNGNPYDNRPENLRWDSRSANQLDAVKHGTHSEARRTSCPQGHKYDQENTAILANGKRRCRTCNREQERERRRKRAA